MLRIFKVPSRVTTERRAKRGNRRRNKLRLLFDGLEPRTLLTATLSVDSVGAASFLSQTLGSTVGLAYNTGNHTYTFDDTEGVAPGTVDAAFTYTQVTGTEATLAPVDFNTQDFTSLSFDQNVEDIAYDVTSLGTPTSFVDTSLTPPVGTPLSDSFDFGATGLAQSLITANVSVALTTESAAITIDDSSDTSAQVIDVTSSQTLEVNYSSTVSIASLVIVGGSGGNTFDVTGTPGSTTTTLSTGTGDNTIDVSGTNSGGALAIAGQGGSDTVDIGLGTLSGILGAITVDNVAADLDTLTIDGSSDPLSHTFDLSSVTSTSTLDDTLLNMPAAITYTTVVINTLTVDAGPSGNQFLNVNFGGGNPIPVPTAAGTPGLTFNAGADTTSAANSHGMNLLGTLPSGAFATEIHNANDPAVPAIGQYGSIDFTDSTSVATTLWYTGLQPINDTTPATTYTFNDFADDQSFTAADGPTVLGLNTIQFANTPADLSAPTFETTNVANKTNIVFNTPNAALGIDGLINIPTASTGLSPTGSLAFNVTTSGDSVANIEATPGGVATTVTMGTGNDLVMVDGPGLPTGVPASSLFVNGGLGTNTLKIGSTGTTVNLSTPGVVVFGNGATFTYANFSTIQATSTPTNTAPVITAGSTIAAVINVPLNNVVVATFTDPDTIETSSSYAAAINWGDGSSSAGTVVQTGTSVVGGVPVNDYSITGTHTYTTSGTFATSVTLTDLGGTFNTNVNGIAVTTTIAPLAPVTSPGATVNVNVLVAGTFTLGQVTAGTLTSYPTLFTFTDNPAPLAAAAYSATINWGDGSPLTAGTITAAAGVFTVAGLHNYGQIGNYTVTVTVHGDGQQLTASTAAGQETVHGLTVTPLVGLTTTVGTLTTPAECREFHGHTRSGL